MTERTIAVSTGDATARIEIYPSVILALPDNVLRAGQEETEKELAKYKASEGDDE